MPEHDAPSWTRRDDGIQLAFRHRHGRPDKPTLVFLPGYASDMQGSKALTLDQWAAETGHAILRLDYAGCGESEGRFEDGTLASWYEDARHIIETQVAGEIALVGSSMGGWIALLLARDLGTRVAALVGIAAAPDFTDWGFSDVEKAQLQAEGQLLRPSDYGPEPMLTTRAFWQAGEALHVLDAPLAVACPVRLLHGQQDADVPWDIALQIADRLCSADVQLHLLKDGDHRLSRPSDLQLLTDVVARLMENL
jgi:pimeloyl-ACP methyl ester carboxylesterase